MVKSIDIKITRKNIIAATIVGIVLTFILYLIGSFYNDIFYFQYQFLIVEIILAVLATLIDETEIKNKILYNLIIVFFLSIIITLCFDFFNSMYSRESEQGINYTFLRFIISVSFCFLVYLLFIAIIGKMRAAIITGTIILFVLAVCSYILLQLRGNRASFADLAAIGTAADIIQAYSSFPLDEYFFFGIFSFLCSIPFLFKLQKESLKITSIKRLAFYLVFIYGFFGIFLTNFETLDYMWFEDENSFVFSFFANAKLLTINPSFSYSEDEVEEVITSADKNVTMLPSGYNADNEIRNTFPDYVARTGSTKPNIIAVMNESFTDLSIFGNVGKEQILPNISSLSNALMGNCYTDVRGGGTADSEYTFLTGNPTILLPNNARPYQLYVHENTPNLVRQLEDVGYTTTAIHPGEANSWNRNVVYDYFGFDKFIDGRSFPGADYRRNEILIEDLITYHKVIETYRNKGDSPMFAFDVTIQNHGGYQQGYNNLEKLAVNENLPDDVVEFLSLMKASDNDFAELINFFSTVDEPTVILMFGDHQPNLTSGYPEYEFQNYGGQYTLEEVQSLQVTPYVVWANYPLPTEQLGGMSLNYLSTLLIECAGLKPSPYNVYLANLFKKFPVIDRKGIITVNKGYYYLDDPDFNEDYEKTIKEYKDVLYYTMIDTKNINSELFEIQEE